MIDSKSIKQGDKVKKNDLVTIKGTGSSKFIPKGVSHTVHRLVAQKLVAEGRATIVGVAPSKPLKARISN